MNMNRKADRAALAARLVEIARSLGFEAEAETLAPPERVTRVTIEAGALHAWISLRAPRTRYSDPAFVVPWHVPYTRDIPGQYLRPELFNHTVNEYHGHKATLVCHGAEGLVSHVLGVLTAHKEGRAFTTAPPKRYAVVRDLVEQRT